MERSDTENGVAALGSLLEEERKALLSGDFERVAILLPAKETLIEEVSREGSAEPSSLRSLSDKVTHNQRLLTGAADGIRTVTERLTALRRVRDSLETYGADGKRRNIGTDSPRSVERRA